MIWNLNVSDEAVTFLLSIPLGFIICFIYDIFRGFRRGGVGNSAVYVFLLDVLFFVFVSVFVFLFLIVRTDGTVRSYVFMGIAIGVELFLLTLSKFALKLFELIAQKTVSLKRFLKKTARKTRLFFENALKRLQNMKFTKKTLETTVNSSV